MFSGFKSLQRAILNPFKWETEQSERKINTSGRHGRENNRHKIGAHPCILTLKKMEIS